MLRVDQPRPSDVAEVLLEEGLRDADGEQRGEAQVGDGNQRARAGGNRVVGAGLGRVAVLPAVPELEPAEDQDEDQDRVREREGAADERGVADEPDPRREELR